MRAPLLAPPVEVAHVVFRRFAPLFVIAFITGVLFRIGNQYGIPVFRMFGTWGIVAMGIWGSSILKRIQRESGLKALEERLGALSQMVRIEEVGAANRLPVWMVHTPRGKLVLGASDVSNSARKGRALQALRRQALAVIDAAARQGAWGAEERPQAVLVLLRRGLKGRKEKLALADDLPPVHLVNPEGLDELVTTGA